MCVTLHSIESRRHKRHECEKEREREKENERKREKEKEREKKRKKERRYHNGFKGRRATSLLLLILLGGII